MLRTLTVAAVAATLAACSSVTLDDLIIDDDVADTDAAADSSDETTSRDEGPGRDEDGTDTRDGGGGRLNACGGAGTLGAAPGAACGACGDGVQACDGPDATVCVGATAASCDAAPALGTPCGRCGGVWRADPGGGAPYCSDDTTNACGGCAPIDTTGSKPGFACAIDDGGGTPQPGVWACVTPDRLRCVPPPQNACGGSATLAAEAIPGLPCGQCLLGTWACDGTDTVVCDSPLLGLDSTGDTHGVNACGGCGPLGATPGTACEDEPLACGGSQWVCDGTTLRCDRAPSNPCGGCTRLSGSPGEACDDGAWACAGPDVAVCVSPAPRRPNVCGGSAALTETPGTPCGSCERGVWACAGPDALACVGDTTDACGGCDGPRARVGTTCAWDRYVWSCDGTAFACTPAGAANQCGGAEVLGASPMALCGPCDNGRQVCQGRDAMTCQLDSARAPRAAYPDGDRDGYGAVGAEPALVCGALPDDTAPVGGDCNDGEFAINPGATELPGDEVDQNCDGRELCFVDGDGDGVLPDDAAVAESPNVSCGDLREATAEAPRGDCDDTDPLVSPLHAPMCLDCVDGDHPTGACAPFRGLVLNEIAFAPTTIGVELANVTRESVSLPVTATVEVGVDGSGTVLFTAPVTATPAVVPSGGVVSRELAWVGGASPLPLGATVWVRLNIGAAGAQDEAFVAAPTLATARVTHCRLPNGLGAFAPCDGSLGAVNE